MREPIFSEGDFTLVKETGTGMNNTPWEGLKVISDGKTIGNCLASFIWK